MRTLPDRVKWVHDKECGCSPVHQHTCMVLARTLDTYHAGMNDAMEICERMALDRSLSVTEANMCLRLVAKIVDTIMGKDEEEPNEKSS